ncbi:MAG TPA: hypothetical protein PK953_10615, partial [Smithellaceae bacterium]|nr:hypothetical protein [Smithellaceae bacterium]
SRRETAFSGDAGQRSEYFFQEKAFLEDNRQLIPFFQWEAAFSGRRGYRGQCRHDGQNEENF